MTSVETPAVYRAARQTGLSNASVADYWALLKPRVMSLVIFTALVGLVRAPGDLHPVLAIVSLLCIAVGAGASGALNMWYDADIDAIMSRTAERPIPSGAISGEESLTFGLILSAFSVTLLGLAVNWLAAGLLGFTIFFYAVVYTMWLKRWTPQNIVIGGAAGAFPPVVAWAASTGSIGWEAVILFAIIFTWTPPHFWALALFKRGDYEKAGIPMLPNVAGVQATKRQIVLYSLVLAPVGVAPFLMGYAGLVYGIISGLGGLAFVALSLVLLRNQEEDSMISAAKKLFAFSILYLFGLYAVLLMEELAMWALV